METLLIFGKKRPDSQDPSNSRSCFARLRSSPARLHIPITEFNKSTSPEDTTLHTRLGIKARIRSSSLDDESSGRCACGGGRRL